MTTQTIILVTSDVAMVATAENKHTTDGRNPVQVFAYETSKNPAGWSEYDGANWANSVGPKLSSKANTVSFSGHGNQEEIGRENNADTGPDLSPTNTATILNTIDFMQNKIILNVCSSHALYNTFSGNLANKLPGIVGDTLKPGMIYHPNKKIDVNRDPLSIVDMNGIEY